MKIEVSPYKTWIAITCFGYRLTISNVKGSKKFIEFFSSKLTSKKAVYSRFGYLILVRTNEPHN